MKSHTKTLILSVLLASIAMSVYPEDNRDKNTSVNNSKNNNNTIAFNTAKNPNYK